MGLFILERSQMVFKAEIVGLGQTAPLEKKQELHAPCNSQELREKQSPARCTGAAEVQRAPCLTWNHPGILPAICLETFLPQHMSHCT